MIFSPRDFLKLEEIQSVSVLSNFAQLFQSSNTQYKKNIFSSDTHFREMTDNAKTRRPRFSALPSTRTADDCEHEMAQKNNEDLSDELVFLTTLLEDQTVQSGNARKLCARHRHSQSLDQTETARLELLQGKGTIKTPSLSKHKRIKPDNQNRPNDGIRHRRVQGDASRNLFDISPPVLSSVPFTPTTSSHATNNISTRRDPTSSNFALVNNNPFLSNSDEPCHDSVQNGEANEIEETEDVSADSPPHW